MNNNQRLFSKLIISGPDSYKFLQGQVTSNLDDLNNNNFSLSAYCNIKGQVISVFYINKNSNFDLDSYNLYFLGDTAEAFLTKIKKYSIFSKITFSPIQYFATKQELDELAKTFGFTEENNYNLIHFLITHKTPIITKNTSEHFFPENINLINLNAVSFKKGCFLGQEVIARMHYKGKSKRKLYNFKITENLVDYSGVNLILSEHIDIKAGEIVFIDNNLGYAVIEDRFVNTELNIENLTLSINLIDR